MTDRTEAEYYEVRLAGAPGTIDSTRLLTALAGSKAPRRYLRATCENAAMAAWKYAEHTDWLGQAVYVEVTTPSGQKVKFEIEREPAIKVKALARDFDPEVAKANEQVPLVELKDEVAPSLYASRFVEGDLVLAQWQDESTLAELERDGDLVLVGITVSPKQAAALREYLDKLEAN